MKTLVFCICTYNRKNSLIDCLKSLENLKNTRSINIKILIVDNSINFNTLKLINNIKKKYKYNITLVSEKKRGVVYARNKCIKNLKILNPNYISFIDDDCTIDKLWLTNILKLIKSKNAEIITGPQLYSKKININYNTINFTQFFEKKYLSNIHLANWAATNNVFFEYKIIKNKKLIFDIALNKFGMGEDQLFFSILKKRGHNLIWSKNVKVFEKSHSHRTDINWLKTRSFRLGVLGHYIDKKLYGSFFGYTINYLKSIFYLLNILINTITPFNKNLRIHLINSFYRFYGRLIGPFIFKKIDFIKK
jgi:succinoglycan biosynthesis protein ExoM